MVYKFKDKENSFNSIEIEENSYSTALVSIINEETGQSKRVSVDVSQIYDLIGCLHSLQAKIKRNKEANNV